MKSLGAPFFEQNRQRVIDKLRGSLLVVPAYTQMQRSNDTAFKFEQEANFWYLTGIEHPDWWLLIDGTRERSWLVAPKVDEVHALFDGSLAASVASEISGVKDVIDAQEGQRLLKEAARKHQFVYTIDAPPHHEHFGFTLNPAARDMRELLSRHFAKVQDFRGKLAELRAIKSLEEIDAIQNAVDLTNETFTKVHKSLKSYSYEYEIEADFNHAFRYGGAAGHAYDPIIAGGANACTLHYGANQAKLQKPSLLLMDVGARAHGYAADITRTYAVGTVTKRQRAVHAGVKSAQQAIIALLKPDLGVEEYQNEVDEIMKTELLSLGLMKDKDDTKSYRRYFPHAISHGLGIDVHDSLGGPRVFREGMVLTVEPGIYIPEEKIGVRIEDDILITKTGYRNLSGKLSTDL